MSVRISLLGILILSLAAWGKSLPAAQDDDPLVFDDIPLKEMVQHPDWFKESFLDLQEDLTDAIQNGKKGIIVYFGQKRCPYCRQLMEINFKQRDIVKYTRDNFDVIAIDIWSPEEVTTPQGISMTERDYALKMGTNFTPSLVFYDKEGKIALRLRGYYPPYQFRAALEYVAGEHYKREPFHVYLARGDSTLRFEAEDMVEEDFFMPPPYNLDRSRFSAERPLAVFFEQGNCHACDILHTQLLRQPAIRKLFDSFESVQLNIHGKDPVVTPDGQKLLAREWANRLGLFYAPTLIFFDENGREIIRVDSVVHFFRLRNVLNFILSKGYLSHPSFQLWRSAEKGR
ncbi:thioredoxin family protein [Thiolapillus sp.]